VSNEQEREQDSKYLLETRQCKLLTQNDGISLCTRSRFRTVPPPTAVMVPTIVAAHVRIVPIRELVDWCKELMKISQGSESKDLHIGIFTAKKIE
jgi:hypothetical protein